jgi:hypothetical protein
MNYVIIFFLAVFGLMTYFSETESYGGYYAYYQEWLKRADARHNGLTDAENWKLQDSLWREITRFNTEGWELIRYEGDMGIEYGDSIMVKKK